MHKNLIFHLCLFTLLISSIKADDVDMVTLISSDEKSFKISKNAAYQSKMIQRLLTDPFKEPKTETPEIKLTDIDSTHLKYIVHALTFISSLYKKYPSQDKIKLQKQAIKALEDHFKKKHFSIDTLRQLLVGANYLDFPALIDSLNPIITPQLSLDTFDPKEWESLSPGLSERLGSFITQKYFFPSLSFTPGMLPHKKLSKEPLDIDFPDNSTDSIPISPNSKFIATTSYDDDDDGDEVENISIWDAHTGKELHVLKGHGDQDILSLDFSSDNKLLVSGSDDETARIWDVKTGQQLHVLSQPGLEHAHFSPDNTLIVTTAKKEAGIWDVKTGRQLRTLRGHTARLNSAYFSPDNTLVVTASSDKTVRIWQVETGTQLHVLRGHTGPVSSALFSPDNTFIITRDDDTVRLWNVKTGEEVHVLEGHTARLTSALFSSDSKLILTSSADGTARIWDVNTGTEIHILKGHTARLTSALFSPDNQLIVTASSDQTARIWDVKTGQQLYILQGHDAPVFDARFSPDTNYIVTDANSPIIWDLTSIQHYLSDNLSLEQALFIKLIARLPQWQDIESLAEHTKHYDVADLKRIFDSLIPPIQEHLRNRFAFFVSPFNADTVTLVSSDGKEFIIDENVAALSTLIYANLSGSEGFEEAQTRTMHFHLIHSDYLSHIVKTLKITAAIYEKTIASLSPKERKSYQEKVIEVLTKHLRPAHVSMHTLLQLRIAADLLDFPELIETLIPLIATGLSLRTVDPQYINALPIDLQKQLIATILQYSIENFYPIQNPLLSTVLSGHTDSIFSSKFSHDNKFIVTASGDGTARIWDAITGTLIHTLRGSRGQITSAQFSHDNTRIVTNTDERTARIWDAKTGTLLYTLRGHTNWVNSAQFSYDNKLIITVSRDNTARIWDAKTGALIHTLAGHTNMINSAQFSFNNKLIVTASDDRTVRIWDAETGTLIHTLTGYIKTVNSAQFSFDNKLLIISSGDYAEIRDVKTGTHIHMLLGHKTRVNSAQFSHDNKLIVTASWDKTTRIWDAKTGILIHTLAGHADRLGSAQFSPDGTKIVTPPYDGNIIRIWNLAPIIDYVLGNITIEQALLVKLLALEKGQTFASLAEHTEHYSVDDLRTIFKNFTPFIQKHLQNKYDLKELTLAQRRRRMQRRLALRRRRLHARG